MPVTVRTTCIRFSSFSIVVYAPSNCRSLPLHVNVIYGRIVSLTSVRTLHRPIGGAVNSTLLELPMWAMRIKPSVQLKSEDASGGVSALWNRHRRMRSAAAALYCTTAQIASRSWAASRSRLLGESCSYCARNIHEVCLFYFPILLGNFANIDLRYVEMVENICRVFEPVWGKLGVCSEAFGGYFENT